MSFFETPCFEHYKWKAAGKGAQQQHPLITAKTGTQISPVSSCHHSPSFSKAYVRITNAFQFQANGEETPATNGVPSQADSR